MDLGEEEEEETASTTWINLTCSDMSTVDIPGAEMRDAGVQTENVFQDIGVQCELCDGFPNTTSESEDDQNDAVMNSSLYSPSSCSSST